jgi:iron complex outermembrane recepter protein
VLLAAGVASAQQPSAPAAPAQQKTHDLTLLSLDELANVEVTSVARRGEPLSETPAAIQVVARADIVASGATTLADALRLAPGVHVAQVDANKWAVGMRGFTSRLARAQLVLVDGRSAYNPLFAGTYWEVQDTLLEDVERIEVVRGPGGTLWGANAVNGVVNVITRSARETQGGYATAGAGNEERAFVGARYGGPLGQRGAYRVYGKYFDRDGGFHRDGARFDDWRMGQGGFRGDFEPTADSRLSLQGDLYLGRIGQRTNLSSYQAPFLRVLTDDAPVSGGNLLGRWSRARGSSSLQLTGYYDRSKREEPTFRETRDSFDIDVQHALKLGSRHQLTWSAGVRASIGDSSGVETVSFVPPHRTDKLATALVQDEIALSRGLRFTLGTKFEHNDYSGFEWQPSARLLWIVSERHSLWAAATRAVRTPSRIEQDIALTAASSATLPVFFRLAGDKAFRSEEIIAFEAGYRARLRERVLLDLAAFHNRYDDLLGIEPAPTVAEPGRTILPLLFRNSLAGKGSGAEAALELRATQRLSFGGQYSLLSLDLHAEPGSADASTAASLQGSSPKHRASVRTLLALPGRLDVSAVLRWVDVLRSQAVPAYTQLDTRVGWRATARLELAAVGRNLLGRHLEFGGNSQAPVEIERSLYGQLLWRW